MPTPSPFISTSANSSIPPEAYRHSADKFVCKDYLHGTCTRGDHCAFFHVEDYHAFLTLCVLQGIDDTVHNDGTPPRPLPVATAQQQDAAASPYRKALLVEFCKDYQVGKCTRHECKFYHGSIELEAKHVERVLGDIQRGQSSLVHPPLHGAISMVSPDESSLGRNVEHPSATTGSFTVTAGPLECSSSSSSGRQCASPMQLPICKEFLSHRGCSRHNCRFSHDVPEHLVPPPFIVGSKKSPPVASPWDSSRCSSSSSSSASPSGSFGSLAAAVRKGRQLDATHTPIEGGDVMPSSRRRPPPPDQRRVITTITPPSSDDASSEEGHGEPSMCHKVAPGPSSPTAPSFAELLRSARTVSTTKETTTRRSSLWPPKRRYTKGVELWGHAARGSPPLDTRAHECDSK